MAMPELTGDINDLAGSSPKNIAAIAALRLYEKYFDNMSTNPEVNVDRMTAALLISCTQTKKREEMWEKYTKAKNENGGNEVFASVIAVGEWYEYMSESLGLSEKSVGGW